MGKYFAIGLCLICVVAGTVRAGERFTIKIGFSATMEDPRFFASTQFKQEVEEKSDGKITVEIYPAGQLGSDAALLEAIALDSGTVDVAMTDVSNASTYEPKAGLSSLPSAFETLEEAWAFMESDIEREIEELLYEHNLRILAHYCNNFRCTTTAKTPINMLEDMKGLLIRTPENPVYMATLRALGANAQPLPFAEVYMALQQGTYDGQENPVSVAYTSKFYEVQKYMALTNHVYAGCSFFFSNSLWESLTPEQQALIKAAAENSAALARTLSKQMGEDYLAKLEEKGMIVTRPDLKRFAEAVKVVYEDLRSVYGDDLLRRFEQWKADYRAAHTQG